MMTMIPSWFPLFVFIFFNRIFENSLLSAEVKEGEILPPTIQKLMKGYNKYLRPFFDNGPVTVGMSLDIASIDTISEINMDYTATIFLRQRWTDERLVFEGNKSLSLDGRLVELLWVPDTFIVDSKKSFLHDITVENRLIRIFPNGTVLYALRITTTVACNMDLTKYPMDKQTCTLQLESWGYNINDVMFYWTRGNESVSGLDTLRLAQYTVEDHYTSVSEAVYETGNYPKLIFHFELKRSILYFILETYVPSSLLVVLSWVSFWISQSSVPARICIGVTTVLTMTTLMMGARTSLPNANCFIKAIDVYLGICFSFIFGALIEYAVAHFCTLHHPDCNALMVRLINGKLIIIYTRSNHISLVLSFTVFIFKYRCFSHCSVLTCLNPQYGGHHMHDCDDDMNGIVTTIASDSSRSKRRKDSPTPAPAPTPTGEPGVVPSSPTSPEAKPPEALTEPLNRCLKNLSLIRQMLRSVNCCHVENPHYIDNYSRVTFPLSFVIVNMLYWTYYLYL
uniref:Gamma-aminobutyric acid receptor subunit pi n=1 Tax=Pygocentrus nattereri TaxID=42514 RepID=A0AAR2KKS3_PYGNA